MKKIRISLSPTEYEAVLAACQSAPKKAALTGAMTAMEEAHADWSSKHAVRRPSMQSKKKGRADTGFSPIGPGVKS